MTATNTAVAAPVAELVKMQTEWDYYHFSETETNDEGLSLRECMERYGVGGWYSNENDMVAALIFLSADKSPGKSWLLGTKHIDGKQEPVRVHEVDLYTYRLSPNTTLGARITNLLSGCVFE